jgi:hypothetical protein
MCIGEVGKCDFVSQRGERKRGERGLLYPIAKHREDEDPFPRRRALRRVRLSNPSRKGVAEFLRVIPADGRFSALTETPVKFRREGNIAQKVF